MVPTKNYKSPNKKTTKLTEKLQISQQKTTNLPTKNNKSPNKKLQISQQKTTNLPTIKLSKIKYSIAQPIMTQYHQVPTITALY